MRPHPGGGEVSTTLDLAPGNYVALCFIPSPAPDLKPHFTKGMVHPFVVVPTAEKREAPASHFTITLNDYNFNISAPIPAGIHDVRVVNAGPQAHEVLIVRLDPGKKAADLLAWFGKGMKDRRRAHRLAAPRGSPPRARTSCTSRSRRVSTGCTVSWMMSRTARCISSTGWCRSSLFSEGYGSLEPGAEA